MKGYEGTLIYFLPSIYCLVLPNGFRDSTRSVFPSSPRSHHNLHQFLFCPRVFEISILESVFSNQYSRFKLIRYSLSAAGPFSVSQNNGSISDFSGHLVPFTVGER
jgi:hypothetical protein